MSQDKTNRDSIKWYFPPRNPPPDLSTEKKYLKDYFQPLNQCLSSDVQTLRNGNNNSISQSTVPNVLESQISNNISNNQEINHDNGSETALVDLSVKANTDSVERTDLAIENSPETEIINQTRNVKRKKVVTVVPSINPPVSNEITLDSSDLSESSPVNKRIKPDSNVNYGESSDKEKNQIPVTRHKTKAFYKQVLPVEPQDLSAKKNPVYNQCSKGIKKYFVSKAASGLKSPRKASVKCDKFKNKIDNAIANQKVTPLKKRKSNFIIDEKSDDIGNVYDFVDVSSSITPRTTRFGRKCNAASEEVSNEKPSRFSPRSKLSKQNEKKCEIVNAPLQSASMKRRTKILNQKTKASLSVDVSKPEALKKYTLRVRNAIDSVKETPNSPPSNVRRSSRLCTAPSPPPLPHESLLLTLKPSVTVVSESKCLETDFQRVLDSLYVTEVVEGNCQGSPIRLKFTRVGQKDSTNAPAIAESPASSPQVPLPPYSIKKHSKKKHKIKKHVRNTNTKLNQYRAILKKAVGKPAIATKQPSNDKKESATGQRSLRQSSILNRKAVEGAEKANQLKRRRWEQQRINSPPKRFPRNISIQAKQSVAKKILNDSEPLEEEAVEYQKPTRNCIKKSPAPKAQAKIPVKARPIRKVIKKMLPKESGKKLVPPRTSQLRISPRTKESNNPAEVILESENKSELQVKSAIQKKCSVKLAPLFTKIKKISEEEVTIIESKVNKIVDKKAAVNLDSKINVTPISLLSDDSCRGTKNDKDSDSNHSFEVLLPLIDFKKVCHIQQKSEDEKLWQLICPDIKCLTKGSEVYGKKYDAKSILDITSQKIQQSKKVFNTPKPLSSHVVIQALKHLEKNSSAIAVKKVFKRYLDYKQFSDHRTSENLNASSTSCDDSDTRTEMCNNRVWTQKYKPCNKQEIIGNSSAVSTLFNWLKRWKIEAEKTIDISERKAKTSDSSDSDSDFEPHQQKSKKSANKVAYDEDDDDDYMCNTMLISGPHGIGKTSSVYALAEELGFKIFEVNVSSKRNGKQVMSHLQEVTQSKQVSNISKNTSDKSNSNIVSFFSKASGKTVSDIEKVQDISSPRLTVEATSLLLFEDIDLVFQEDEGFLNAVSNFMSNTKRPIILTTNDKNYSSLNKLKGDYEELEYLTPPTDVVAQHLQLIALAENMLIRCKDIETLVKYHSGDIRKCILSLQYGITSGGWNQEKAITCSEQSECDVKGSSGESLPKNKSSDMRFNTEVPSLFAPSSCLQTQFGLPFVNTTKELHIKGLMDLTDTLRLYLENHIDLIQSNGIRLINLPKCQIEADSSEKIGESKNITKSGDMPDSSHKCEKCLLNQLDYCNCNNSKKHNSCINQKFLNPLLSFFDNISACDSFLETARNSELEAIGQPVTAGLCTDEITDDISQFWRNDVDIAASIQCHNLFSANQYVKRCMNSVNSNESSFADCKIALFDENQIIVNNSFLEESNLEKNSLLVENEVKRSGSIPLTSYTNIRAKVLDYTPTIRSICRTESHRSEFSNKRSGRFLHYLDSISVELSTSTQQKLLNQFK